MKKDWRQLRGRAKYEAYLCSPEWGQKRRAVFERSKGICEHCDKRQAVAVHHNTYERKYNELLSDLEAVCQLCHDYAHGRVSIEEMYDADYQLEPCSRCKRMADLVGRTGADWFCEPCSFEMQSNNVKKESA